MVTAGSPGSPPPILVSEIASCSRCHETEWNDVLMPSRYEVKPASCSGGLAFSARRRTRRSAIGPNHFAPELCSARVTSEVQSCSSLAARSSAPGPAPYGFCVAVQVERWPVASSTSVSPVPTVAASRCARGNVFPSGSVATMTRSSEPAKYVHRPNDDGPAT